MINFVFILSHMYLCIDRFKYLNNIMEENKQFIQEESNHNSKEYDTQPNNNVKSPIKPSNNLVWAILTTIFCCLPLGVVSIVYALQVDSLWAQGLYEEARRSARNARNWALASAISVFAIMLLYIIVIMVWVGVIAFLVTGTTNHTPFTTF